MSAKKEKGLSKFFSSKKKKEPEPTCQDVLERLTETETMLLKKQQFLEHKINQELASAKKYSATNRQLALRYIFFFEKPTDLCLF